MGIALVRALRLAAFFFSAFLAAALRGSHAAAHELPKLRDDHRRLIEARQDSSPGSEFLLLETDRLTVSLNTLREQVLRYIPAN